MAFARKAIQRASMADGGTNQPDRQRLARNLNEITVTDFRGLAAWLILFAVTNIAVPSAAAEQVPSCDLFRKRFAEAPRILSLRLPNSRLSREPPDRFEKHDVWKTEATRADDGELWYTTGVYCSGQRFDYVAADIDTPAASLLHPTFDLIAASIYAFTGWDADKVIRTTNEVLKNRSRDMADIKITELSPGAYAKDEFFIIRH